MTGLTNQGTDLVLSERDGGVLVLTLNRPDRLNAWNVEMEREYFSLLEAAENDAEVRAIVLTGASAAVLISTTSQARKRSRRTSSSASTRATIPSPSASHSSGRSTGLRLGWV